MSSAAACCFCMVMISAMLAVDTTLVSCSANHRASDGNDTFSVDSMDLRSLHVPLLRRLLPWNSASVVDVCFRNHAPSHT